MQNTTEFAIDLALTAEGEAPEWIHLLPLGRFTARDGREFDNADPDAVIATFEARAVDLPIDYEHQNDRPEARLNGPVPAAGWIKELRRRADGIWGRVEWTPRARGMIANREYRYISPAIRYLKDSGRIAMLKGAGLVHSPALHLTALAEEEADALPTTLAAKIFAAVAGLSPNADIAAVRAMLDRLRGMVDEAAGTPEATAPLSEAEPGRQDSPPDPASFVPTDTLQAVLIERNQAQAELRERDARARVEDAFARGYLSTAMRGWAMALCLSDPESFDLFIEKSIPPFANLCKPVITWSVDKTSPPARGSAEAIAICEQLGLDPGALAD